MKHVSKTMLWLAAIGLVIPPAGPVSAVEVTRAAPAAAKTPLVDVSLDAAKQLRGQLVDRQGAGKVDQKVRLLSGTDTLAETVTDRQGGFRLPVEKGGIYTLSDGQSSALVRVWTQKAAPPAAKEGVLMVSDPELTRARLGGGGMDSVIAWAAIIGVTAAVVWAVTDDDDDGS